MVDTVTAVAPNQSCVQFPKSNSRSNLFESQCQFSTYLRTVLHYHASPERSVTFNSTNSTFPAVLSSNPPPTSTPASSQCVQPALSKWTWEKSCRKAARISNDPPGDAAPGSEPLLLKREHWLEATDPKHRYGSYLRPYYDHWVSLQPIDDDSTPDSEQFFAWLDAGDGRQVDLTNSPRAILEASRVRYLTYEERGHFEVYVDRQGRLRYLTSDKLVHTHEDATADDIDNPPSSSSAKKSGLLLPSSRSASAPPSASVTAPQPSLPAPHSAPSLSDNTCGCNHPSLATEANPVIDPSTIQSSNPSTPETPSMPASAALPSNTQQPEAPAPLAPAPAQQQLERELPTPAAHPAATRCTRCGQATAASPASPALPDSHPPTAAPGPPPLPPQPPATPMPYTTPTCRPLPSTSPCAPLAPPNPSTHNPNRPPPCTTTITTSPPIAIPTCPPPHHPRPSSTPSLANPVPRRTSASSVQLPDSSTPPQPPCSATGPTPRDLVDLLLYRRWGQVDDALQANGKKEKCGWIYVMDITHRIYIHRKQRGQFHHSSFVCGAAVLAAGGLEVRHGQIEKLSAHSGHYRPDEGTFLAFVEYLKEKGADLQFTRILGVSGKKAPADSEADAVAVLAEAAQQSPPTGACAAAEEVAAKPRAESVSAPDVGPGDGVVGGGGGRGRARQRRPGRAVRQSGGIGMLLMRRNSF